MPQLHNWRIVEGNSFTCFRTFRLQFAIMYLFQSCLSIAIYSWRYCMTGFLISICQVGLKSAPHPSGQKQMGHNIGPKLDPNIGESDLDQVYTDHSFLSFSSYAGCQFHSPMNFGCLFIFPYASITLWYDDFMIIYHSLIVRMKDTARLRMCLLLVSRIWSSSHFMHAASLRDLDYALMSLTVRYQSRLFPSSIERASKYTLLNLCKSSNLTFLTSSSECYYHLGSQPTICYIQFNANSEFLQ